MGPEGAPLLSSGDRVRRGSDEMVLRMGMRRSDDDDGGKVSLSCALSNQ